MVWYSVVISSSRCRFWLAKVCSSSLVMGPGGNGSFWDLFFVGVISDGGEFSGTTIQVGSMLFSTSCFTAGGAGGVGSCGSAIGSWEGIDADASFAFGT